MFGFEHLSYCPMQCAEVSSTCSLFLVAPFCKVFRSLAYAFPYPLTLGYNHVTTGSLIYQSHVLIHLLPLIHPRVWPFHLCPFLSVVAFGLLPLLLTHYHRLLFLQVYYIVLSYCPTQYTEIIVSTTSLSEPKPWTLQSHLMWLRCKGKVNVWQKRKRALPLVITSSDCSYRSGENPLFTNTLRLWHPRSYKQNSADRKGKEKEMRGKGERQGNRER